MLFKILDSFFTEYELQKKVSSFITKFDYNKLKQGKDTFSLLLLLTYLSNADNPGL